MRRKTQAKRALAAGLLAGAVAGVVLGWLTAPRTGARLRAQTRQKLGHWTRQSGRYAYKAGKNLTNHVQGAGAVVWERLRRVGGREPHYVDANTLVDQVHSQLGRQFGSDFAHVNLNAVDHTLYLHGFVTSKQEREKLITAVAAIEGVEIVRSEGLRVLAPGETPPPEDLGLRRVL